MKVQLSQVSKRFGSTTVVNGVSFEIQNGEMFFLLGPSGCGKTTVLRMVAGFYQPDGGEIRFDDRVVNVLPPNKRNTGMVFQNYALWPHMSVAENVAYGLDVRDVSAAEKDQRVEEALAIVQMTSYAERSPTQLSGGQQQRVALARALVIKPDILLLDEPLSNLDAKLRLEMRDEIKRIHRETGLTTLYVTHDQKEALSLADRIAIMNRGAIEQIGSPREIYRAPKSCFVAQFIGEMNFVTGTIDRIDEGRGVDPAANVLVQTKVGLLRGHSNLKLEAGQKVQCGFRPEAVRIGSNGSNPFASIVQDTTYLGEVEQFHLKLNDGTEIKAQLINPDRPHKRGELLEWSVEPRDLIVLDAS
jgi:iron(III) transport system ATP-binding protein